MEEMSIYLPKMMRCRNILTPLVVFLHGLYPRAYSFLTFLIFVSFRRHNPGCVMQNNPHYALHIFRTSELRITLSQTDTRGMTLSDAKPCAMYLVKVFVSR